MFQTLLENLEILDSLTAEGMLSGSLRAALGHPSPPCSHDAMSIKVYVFPVYTYVTVGDIIKGATILISATLGHFAFECEDLQISPIN